MRPNIQSLLFIILLALVGSAELVFSQERGMRMFVTVDKATVLKDGEPWSTLPVGEHFYIEDVAPNFYTFRHLGELVWIKHEDCVSVDEAIEFFSERIEKTNSAMDLVCRAKAYYHRQKFELATEDLDAAEELSEEFVHLYITRSAIACDEGDFETAYEEIQLAEEIDPDHPTVLNILGLIAYHEDDSEEAEEYYNRCLEVDPSYSVALNNRALVYLELGENDKAEADYKKAIELTPARPIVYVNYAWYLENYADDIDKALENLNTAIEIDPQHGQARYYRAGIHELRDNIAQYAVDMKIAVDRSPKEFEWKDDFAWFLATTSNKELRNGAAAIEYAKYCVELTQWEDADHVCTLAAGYGACEQFDKALEILDKAREADEHDNYSEYIEPMAECFEEKRQYEPGN